MTSKAKRNAMALLAASLPFFYSRRKAPEEKQPQNIMDRMARQTLAYRKREMRASKLRIQAATWKQQHA